MKYEVGNMNFVLLYFMFGNSYFIFHTSYLEKMLDKQGIAKRIAQELQNNWYVNLGIGIPTLIANYVPEGLNVDFQSENGLLGMGPFPFDGEEDADMINAGKQTVTLQPGATLFDSSTSFAMIRGKHVQLTVLGAMEVSQNGDIANWKIPGRMVKGMGGAMDLVASAENIIVAMMHTNKRGKSKILKSCTLPLTGVNCVTRIVTNMAVLDVENGAFRLIERAPGVSVEEIQAATEGTLIVEGEIPEMVL
ncbi:MAG: 3-oxoacid CoA-transferase subunit B [Saprospiraceae bacterium]|jgi:3-oxoacid CoA-transferase subunit B